jgi:uncharacterized protein (UPF0276 family)
MIALSLQQSRDPRMPLPAVGAGLKPDHAEEILAGTRRTDFFEIHAENYMGAGGPPHRLLHRIREDYPLSIHGVGLSIGGISPLDREHLGRLRRLIKTYQPALFSEHLAWSTHDGVFLNDLLPLPYNDISLAHVCVHIEEVQDALGMPMLLENPSTYVAFHASSMTECAAWPSAPVADCCSTSTMFMSVQSITDLTLRPISMPFRSNMSSKYISRDLPKTAIVAGRGF